MNQETLQSMAKELSVLDLQQLQLEQMKHWLAKFQQKYQSLKNQQQNQSVCKTKIIRKFNNKNSFKKYIKQRIPSIIGRSLNTVFPRSSSSTDENQKYVRTKGGKSRYRKSMQNSNNAKYIRFFNNLEDSLKKWNLEELNCPICLQTMIAPALTACGHVFCLQCIDQSSLFSQSCPNCRQSIKLGQPLLCSALNNLIKAKILIQQTQTERFEERVKKYEKWFQNRFMNYEKVKAGDQVDIRDTESIWCRGTIMKTYRKANKHCEQKKTIALLVHYHRWNKLYNQIIDVPSSRLAPLNYFSGRIDIPRYNLAQDDQNLRGSVVTGLTIRNQLSSQIHLFFRDFNQNDEIVSQLGQYIDENASDEENEEQQQESEEEIQVDSQPQGSSNREEQRLGDSVGFRFRNNFHSFVNDYRRDIQLFLGRNSQQVRNEPEQVQQRQQSEQNPQVQIQSDEQPLQYDYSFFHLSSERVAGDQPSDLDYLNNPQIWNLDSTPMRNSSLQRLNQDREQRQDENSAESEISQNYQ